MKLRHLLLILAAAIACSLHSCKEYGSDLQQLGSRVEALEASTLNYNNVNKSIQTLLMLAQNNGFVTNIAEAPDGTVTLTLKGDWNHDGVLTDSTVVLKNGVTGTDGHKLGDLLTIQKDGDTYYFVYNGTWLRDDYGRRIAVRGTDGRDGRDGKDADATSAEFILPQMRIDSNGYWEISLDGGITWKPTGKRANGNDGQPEPYILDLQEEEDRILITTLVNGQVVTIVIPKYVLP